MNEKNVSYYGDKSLFDLIKQSIQSVEDKVLLLDTVSHSQRITDIPIEFSDFARSSSRFLLEVSKSSICISLLLT